MFNSGSLSSGTGLGCASDFEFEPVNDDSEGLLYRSISMEVSCRHEFETHAERAGISRWRRCIIVVPLLVEDEATWPVDIIGVLGLMLDLRLLREVMIVFLLELRKVMPCDSGLLGEIWLGQECRHWCLFFYS